MTSLNIVLQCAVHLYENPFSQIPLWLPIQTNTIRLFSSLMYMWVHCMCMLHVLLCGLPTFHMPNILSYPHFTNLQLFLLVCTRSHNCIQTMYDTPYARFHTSTLLLPYADLNLIVSQFTLISLIYPCYFPFFFFFTFFSPIRIRESVFVNQECNGFFF